MKIYNTLTRDKEEFVPLFEHKALIYACGPTVYNYIHIGNARPACVFDVLRRFLEYRGFEVRFVQNFTDVDDKIIKKANEEGVSSAEIGERYIAEYQTDAEGLNIRPATVHPRATENIGRIIGLIKSLIDGGFAYEKNGDVYFRVAADGQYGKLSHMPLEELRAGARIEVGETKEDPMDFALWKAAKPGEPHWQSPWGEGRPGWHIECSAMAKGYLGDTIDIHCGGQDLVFPHHENEIAQSESANGVPFARYWMHNGYINVDHRKMSKSLGNFFTVREVAKEYGYEPIRFLMLQAHYRSPINYSREIMEQCVSSLTRLYTCRDTLSRAIGAAKEIPAPPEALAGINAYREEFIAAMEDDLNTADGIAAVFELVRAANAAAASGAGKAELSAYLNMLTELCGVLGLLYQKPAEEEIPAEVAKLAADRAAARKAKDFALADRLREEIAALGYLVEETRQGTRIKKAGSV